MKVFISHSSKDNDIVLLLRELILKNGNDVTVFSDDNSFLIGRDFSEKISKNILDSNIVIVLLSDYYVSSKYCLIELGMICSFMYMRDIEIIPFCIYPVRPNNALAGTPLASIQCRDLSDPSSISYLLKRIHPGCSLSNYGIYQFSDKIVEYICSQDIIYNQIESTQVCAYGEGLIVKNWGDFVSYQKNDSNKEIEVSYNLNPYGLKNQGKPEFISLVLKYNSSLDLSPFARFGNEAKIVFKLVNYTDSIHRISVEIKRSPGEVISMPFEFELNGSENKCEIPFNSFGSGQLKEVDEICFVLRPEDLLEDEGTFIVKDIEILA